MPSKKESENIKVSVLVPVYNVDKYLERCLMSLVEQTLDGIEVLCLDDGSTDQSLDILNWYAAQRDNFRVIHKKNSGYGESMNIGFSAARGKYIGILESDDFADRRMFQWLYEAAEEQNAEVVRSNFYDFRSGVDSFHDNMGAVPCDAVYTVYDFPELILSQPSIWAGIYLREFLLESDIWFTETPGASYQDMGFTLKYQLRAKRMCAISQATVHYRQDNPSSSVNVPVGKGTFNRIEFDSVWQYLAEHPDMDPRARYLIPPRQYESSRWLLAIMPREEQDAYFRQVLEDFRWMDSEGVLWEKYFPEKWMWEAVQRLLSEGKPLWDHEQQRIAI